MRIRHLALFVAPVFAALALTQPARANVMIVIDKSQQKMSVSVDGEHRYTWPVSTGRPGYDTPSGDFQPFRMERDHFSREWDDAPMPNSVFFTKIGHAIHGTLETRNLGRPASHGCVRLSVENSATLFALVKQEGVFNTHVRLVGEIPKASDVPVARREPAKDRDTARNANRDISRAYVRNYTTGGDNDDAAASAQQQRGGAPNSSDPRGYYYRPPYYQQQPYYQQPSYGRGLFQPGW